MSRATLTLNHFIQPVPVCEQKANLEAVLAIFQSGQHEAIVVVSEQQSPLGVIHCRRLMPHLVKRLLVRLTEPFGSGLSSRNNPRDDPQPDLSLIDLRSLMKPIATLPAQMSVKEFWPYLQAGHGLRSNQSCALVDSEGKFLGLLDSLSLLKSLLPTSRDFRETTSEKPPQTFRQPLFHLLEQLPLPLMLQTAEGSVLHQNLTWREQIGEFIPPNYTSPLTVEKMKPVDSKQKFLLLENAPGQTSEIQSDCLKDSYYLAAQLSRCQLQGLAPHALTPEVAVKGESFGQPRQQWHSPKARSAKRTPSEKPKTAPERVWQFVKLPLNFPNPYSPRSQTQPGNVNPQSQIWLVLATDVTEQQRLCKELAQKNADLVQLNRLKDEFLAYISHELKSPLTAIVGLSSLLKEQKLGELNQRQACYAELIYQSGRRLMTLVNDILDLTRLEIGQLKLTPEPVQVKSVCQRAYESINEKKKGKTDRQLQFTLEIEHGLEMVVADELRLHQMLVHLLDNAFKFTQAGGEIGLKVNRWENWIAFTVWDTGIGIPEESQHLIFQKLQQLESPLSRQFEGTGLGLVLTQRLARVHGGDVSFISKVGKGSQFTLLLPPSPTDKRMETGNVNPQKKRNQLVLIVEAIPRYIENLTEKLRGLGYRVIIARAGTEALEKARQLQPYAILLNPVLPLLSGWDVLNLLKSDARTKDIPVIVTATQADKQQAEQNGANGFLSLPLEERALQEILGSEQLSSQIKSLTILHLHPDLGKTSWVTDMINCKFNLVLGTQSSGLNYRILEADDLEQAEILARVWKIDVVVLDCTVLSEPLTYLRSLSECECLASLPLVTLDAKTTEAANQVRGLSVFPCLVPANEQNLAKLLQVIQIAAGMRE
ncbi:MAG: ATP-binding protein [Xenococcaceae cyanobacterium]